MRISDWSSDVCSSDLGLTIAGVAATTLVGAAVGSWVTALIGSMVPDEVHRRFESEIRAGRLLIVVDETPGTMAAAAAAMREAGAEPLPSEATRPLHPSNPHPALEVPNPATRTPTRT